MAVTVVYLLTFSNGKLYVGVTSDLDRRLRQHRSKDSLVGNAMRRHSWEVRVLFQGSSEECYREEVAQITQLDCKAPKGYNLTDGDQNNQSWWDKPENRLEHAAKMRQLCSTPEAREKLAQSSREGWKTRDKSAASAAVRKGYTPERSLKISEGMKRAWAAKKQELLT